MNGIYKLLVIKILALLIALSLYTGAFAQSFTPSKANFVQDKTKGCLPLVVNFTNTSTGSITNYFWDFGNGNTSSLKNPGAIYNQAGTYTVLLVVTDANGDKDTLLKPFAIEALANPQAGFEVSANGACIGQNFTFTDTSKKAVGNIAKWQWGFGDGSADTTPNPKHSFGAAGTFGVSLIITDDNGCKSFVNHANLITVTPPAQVAFDADNRGGCTIPLQVKFTNNTKTISGHSYNYKWQLGGNVVSTQENPAHTYTAMGQNDITLTVTDDNNCSQTLTKSKFINIGKTKADFKLVQNKGCVPFMPALEDKSIGVGTNTTWVWHFGNGDSAVGQLPKYTYKQAGTYTITLSVSSPSGCNDVEVKKDVITVLPAPVATFGHNNPISCTVPYTVSFSPTNQFATKLLWEFGDGETSTQKNPSKVYDTSGVFSVSLTLTDANGCKGTFEKKDIVKVNTHIANFEPTVKYGCVPLQVGFSNNSSSFFGINSYTWDFGNGQTSNTQQAQTVFNAEGTYYPRLIIVDNNGCTDTMVYDSIMVGIKTNPDFYTHQTKGCKSDMRFVDFHNTTDTINQRVDGFFWDFGVLTSTESNPIIDYRQYPSTYTVKLISVSNGCADTMVKKDYITILMPHANAAIIEDPCKLDTVTFKDKSVGAHKFNWTLDGVSIGQVPEVKKFLQPGSYVLDLMVQDTNTGCWDTKSYVLDIHEPLLPGFTISADSVCANVPFLVNDTSVNAIKSTFYIGNNNPIVAKQIAHVISQPYTPFIRLEVEDKYGCKETLTKTNAIKILGPEFTPSITPDKGCFPLDAKLVKTGFSAHGVANAYWSDNKKQYPALADSVPYLFNTKTVDMHTKGVAIILTVEDNMGCKVSRTASVKLSQPLAEVQHSSKLLCSSTQLNFDHYAGNSQHIGALSYNWVLNSNQTFNQQANSFSFNTEGTQTLKLVVRETALGCVDSSVREIPINLKKIKAGFSIDNTATTCPPLVSTFADKSTVQNTSIQSVEWLFGDGAVSKLTQPVKSYFYPGNYDITYKVTDVDGCTDSVVLKNQIKIGGPIGRYYKDADKGCVPFKVNFSSQSQNAKTVSWDFGNGTLSNAPSATAEYVITGTFVPTMVLEDAAGCKVAYPVDPIKGYASPKPSFSTKGNCLYDVFELKNQTDTNTLPTKFVWLFENGDSNTAYNNNKTFASAGKHQVILKAIAPNGCEATTTQTINIKSLKAAFTVKENPVCRFDYINLTDQSIAEAGIESYQWSLGDGRVDSIQNPFYYYNTPGEFSVGLIVKDKNGCFDTLAPKGKIIIFDTLTPPTPLAHRVTVEENNTVRLEFSPYLSREFDSYVIFRSTLGKGFELYKTIQSQLDTILIDNDVNTHAQTYSYKVFSQTKCDKLSSIGESEKHTTVLLKTTADTNRVILKFTPYSGWDNLCNYTIHRQSPTDNSFVKIAAVGANDSSYIDNDVICGYTYHYAVYAHQEGKNALLSRSNNSTAAPIHKSTVQPAQLVRATVQDDNHILVEFSQPVFQKTPIDYYTIEKSADGINYKDIFTTKECCKPFEDFSVDVHNQSYYYRIRTADVCGDISAAGNIGKTILLSVEADDDENVNATWSNYQKWDDGIASYQIELKDINGMYNWTGENTFDDTTFTDESNLYNQLPQVCYRIKATSNNGTISYSNTDCAKGRSSLFVPNAFTPNGDQTNNKFVIIGTFIKKFEINIYNRYGEKLFTSNDLENSWDGMYKSETAEEGAYLYVINAQGMDYKYHNYSGTVTLLR